MVRAQGSLDPLIDFIDYPGCLSTDDLSFSAAAVFLVIDIEIYIQYFSLCWVIIYLLLHKTVNLVIIDSDNKSIIWLGLVVDPNFLKGVQTVHGNRKRKELVSGTVSLVGDYHILSHLKLTKLGYQVENNRHTNVLAFEQETELGAPNTPSK